MLQHDTSTIQPTKTSDKEDIYSLLSKILSYPGTDYQNKVESCRERLGDSSAVNESFKTFSKFARQAELTELEELFTATFDLNDKRPLEVGWHLFGEEYKRGQFLVKMRGMLRKYQVEESTELPDHLSHCLLLLPKLDQEEAEEFANSYVEPALENILEGFDNENPFKSVIHSLKNLISENYGRQEE